MTDTITDVLRRARQRISDPARWTQGAYARDASGRGVPSRSHAAVCWCADGALIAETQDSDDAIRLDAYRALKDVSQGSGPVYTNDHEGHAAVLAMFDRALATQAARQDGG